MERAPRPLGDVERLRPDELRLKHRVAILEQHIHDFPQLRMKFVQRLALRVRAGPAGDIPDEQAGRLIAFDYSRKGAHAWAPVAASES